MIPSYSPNSWAEGITLAIAAAVYFITGWWWILVIWLGLATALYAREWQLERRRKDKRGKA